MHFYDFLLNLQDKLDTNLKKHDSGLNKENIDDQTDAFFSQIPKDLILKLYDYCKRDYEMFGYPSPYKYM